MSLQKYVPKLGLKCSIHEKIVGVAFVCAWLKICGFEFVLRLYISKSVADARAFC